MGSGRPGGRSSFTLTPAWARGFIVPPSYPVVYRSCLVAAHCPALKAGTGTVRIAPSAAAPNVPGGKCPSCHVPPHGPLAPSQPRSPLSTLLPLTPPARPTGSRCDSPFTIRIRSKLYFRPRWVWHDNVCPTQRTGSCVCTTRAIHAVPDPPLPQHRFCHPRVWPNTLRLTRPFGAPALVSLGPNLMPEGIPLGSGPEFEACRSSVGLRPLARPPACIRSGRCFPTRPEC